MYMYMHNVIHYSFSMLSLCRALVTYERSIASQRQTSPDASDVTRSKHTRARAQCSQKYNLFSFDAPEAINLDKSHYYGKTAKRRLGSTRGACVPTPRLCPLYEGVRASRRRSLLGTPGHNGHIDRRQRTTHGPQRADINRDLLT